MNEDGLEKMRTLPWATDKALKSKPESGPFGYAVDELAYAFDNLQALKEGLKIVPLYSQIQVWTPDSPYRVPIGEVGSLFDIVANRRKKKCDVSLRESIFWVAISGFLVIFLWMGTSQIFNYFWFGLMLCSCDLLPAIYRRYNVDSFSPEILAKEVLEDSFVSWINARKAPWTRTLIGCIALVGIFQTLVQFSSDPIESAGVVKGAIREGEIWRLATGTLLHGNFLHFFLNMTALLSLGKLLEVLAGGYLLPLVFILAAIGGSICSLYFLPETTSVGSSGGIMGILGFLIVFGYRNRSRLPPLFLRKLLTGVCYVLAIGLLAFYLIDNAGHMGGLLAGLLLGMLLTDRNRQISTVGPNGARRVGVFAMLVVIVVAGAALAAMGQGAGWFD